MDEQQLDAWVGQIRARGWVGVICTVLDMIEPIAPLAAQLLYVGHPVSRIIARDFPLEALADALETADGVSKLRKRLRDE
jgi:hypothetical protein